VQCSLLSPKPGASGASGSAVEAKAIALKVFAHFPTASAALACGKELHGKQFDGRTVVASFVSETTFEELRRLPCYAA
jgi:splicing factor U2AF subunit